ncbi:MAG: beta-galactosidase, partial [Chloroflexota bacterium]|nr:beta-galactosidase [Chloroflexota bacterium]
WRRPAYDMPVVDRQWPRVGFTYSPRQAEYLDLPWRETFDAALALSPAVVRLGAYWSEIEAAPDAYDFSRLDWLLDRAAARGVPVVLTVGMKAPRWPEYYLPAWLEERVTLPEGAEVSESADVREQALDFVTRVVERYRDHPAVRYWQVENEPLAPVGPHDWRIGVEFLRREVALVRELDPLDRPIVINTYVRTHPFADLPPWKEDVAAKARAIVDLADIMGLDVYVARGFAVAGLDVYLDWSWWRWERDVLALRQLARDAGKPTWITEAQAEPWEPGLVVYTRPPPAASLTPSTAAYTATRLQAIGAETILLWGVEHWYMRLARYEDPRWWSALGPFPFFTRAVPHATDAVAKPGP